MRIILKQIMIVLFSTLFFIQYSCLQKKVEFNSELWIQDTITFSKREAMIYDIFKKRYLYFWDLKEALKNLGEPSGRFMENDIIHVTYRFEQVKRNEKIVHYTYLDLSYSQDSTLQHFDIIEWDTLTKFKRVYIGTQDDISEFMN